MRVVFFVLLLVALAACNSTINTSDTPTVTPVVVRAGTPTAAPPVVNVGDGADKPAPTESVSQTNSTTGSETIDCGQVVLSGNPPHAASASIQAASSCYLKAFSACQAATLTVRGPDAGVTRQFSIESTTKCVIHEALQPDPSSAPAVVDCSTVQPDGIGMIFSDCSHLGDFSITP